MEVRRQGADVLAVYGRPMTEGATPDEAAEGWLAEHAGVFNVEGLDLRLVRKMDLSFGKATVYTYAQYMGGVRVENARARIIVRNGKPSEVIYVSARLAHPPAAGFRTDRIAATEAATNVRALPEYAELSEWSAPELVVFYYDGKRRLDNAVKAWKLQGRLHDAGRLAAHTFFVDAADGTLVHVRNDVHGLDIAGHVEGRWLADGDLGPYEDSSSVPATLRDMEDVCVHVVDDCPDAGFSFDECTFSDADGDFTIPHEGTSAVDVETGLLGRWVTITTPPDEEGGYPLRECDDDVTPPGPASFTFNNPQYPTEFDTAQVNAFVHITRAHNFWTERQAAFTELDCSLDAEVNSDIEMVIGNPGWTACGASFQTPWPNDGTCLGKMYFHRAGGYSQINCRNTAYSTVIAHEYGHFVLSALPNGPPVGGTAFSEGFCDALAAVTYDTTLIARDLCGSGTFIRNILCETSLYPCPDDHLIDCTNQCIGSDSDFSCGQTLAAIWWTIKSRLETSLGDNDEALARMRELFTTWALIADEPPPNEGYNDSADRGTATEVLVGDDLLSAYGGDGDLSNGTPHLDEICGAFQTYNIPCVDCNRNGQWDACDIDCNASTVCNQMNCGNSDDVIPVGGNGIPDECDEIVVYYVDRNVSGGADDCSSWPNACDDLQEGLDAAAGQWQHAQIWVAEGTYKPSRLTDRTDARSATFPLLNDTELYGGFLGNAHPQGGETDLSERDFENNVTILSGDLGGATSSDNAYHVVTGSGTDGTAVIDGFTITAGYANVTASYFKEYGGGMINLRGSPTVRNCVFSNNKAKVGGGAMFNRDYSSPAITDCDFITNSVRMTEQAANGGAIYNEDSSSPTLIDCFFLQNEANASGGAIYSNGYSGPSTLFTEVHPTLINCRFEENKAQMNPPSPDTDGDLGGGAVYYRGGTLAPGGTGRMTDCTFKENLARRGGAVMVHGGSARLTNCKFYANQAFLNNFGSAGGALFAKTRFDTLRLFNCLFDGNKAKYHGGAVAVVDNGAPGAPQFINCTFSANVANLVNTGYGGGIYNLGDCSPVITNCVFWGNSDYDGIDESSQIHDVTGQEGPGVPVVTYSLLHDLDVLYGSGVGNIEEDAPDVIFADHDGPDDQTGDENDDLHQTVGSPVIDAGTNDAVPIDLTTDLDGSARIINDVVDMGAYELFGLCEDVYDCGDTNEDGISDDNCRWFDCNAGYCTVLPRIFADAGGAYGACEPDGFCNIHDANLALACFQSTTTCEPLNIDIGGSFGACDPDGYCNIHDASHALSCFAGTNTCTCPPVPTPDFEPPAVDDATISLVVDAGNVAANATVRVRAFLTEALPDFQSYQLHLGVSGGTVGQLELIDIAIEPRDDYVFAGLADQFEAFNVDKGQMLSGLKFHSVPTQGGAYLAMFTYRVSNDADGDFVIDVLHDATNEDQTFLLASYIDRIEVNPVTPAVVTPSPADP